MIDIHSHAMPFVDDGCDSWEKALFLLSEECKLGVTDLILTPHFREEYILSKNKLKEVFNELKNKALQNKIPLNLYLGQEIFVDKTVKKLLQSGELLTLNGTEYVLLEFDYKEECEIADIVYEFKRSGYKPVVAHLERYSYVTEEDASEIKELGGFIQVNADSFFIKEKTGIKKRANAFLKQGLIDFVAADIHWGRKNYIKKAYSLVKRRKGRKNANLLFCENAKQIINKG